MTFRTGARRFLRQMEADGKSPLTVQVYRGELERFGGWLGSRPLAKVRPDTVARYLTSPAALTSPDGTPRSARTVNRTKAALRLLFTYLAETGAVRDNPARLLRNARVDRPIPVALTDDETRRFTHALDLEAKASAIGKRDRALFTLLLCSGMRLAAALALDVADLDLATGTATSCGKNGRNQGVVLPRNVTRTLAAYLKNTSITAGPVFRSRNGRRLSSRMAQYRFHALVELADIDRRVTVHSLRHTFANRLRRKTGDLRVVQAALGHRSLSTTEAYTEVSRDELRRAMG